MSKIQFDMLELPTEEEIYPQNHGEDEPHPLKDEEWMYDLSHLTDTIQWMAKDLRQQVQYLTEQTNVIRKFEYIKSLLEKYGSHAPDCKYMSIAIPRLGEEYSSCTCGWYELRPKLKRSKRSY